METGVGLVLLIAVLAANLPFMTTRVLGVLKVGGEKGKSAAWCLAEWLLLYVVVAAIAWLVEGRFAPVHVQNWPFYASTFCLFMVFAFPGFSHRFFCKRRGG